MAPDYQDFDCPHCGARLPGNEHMTRCYECGRPLGDVTWPQKKRESSRTAQEQNTVAGSTLGGAIMGASLGGPGGALVGGFLGWMLGENVNKSRREEAEREQGAANGEAGHAG